MKFEDAYVGLRIALVDVGSDVSDRASVFNPAIITEYGSQCWFIKGTIMADLTHHEGAITKQNWDKWTASGELIVYHRTKEYNLFQEFEVFCNNLKQQN